MTVNEVTRNNIARLNSDGSTDLGFGAGVSGANKEINCMAVQSDAKVLIGGRFTSVNDMPKQRIAAINSDGSTDPVFGTDPSGPDDLVTSVAIQCDGKVLIGDTLRPSAA